MEDTYRPGHKRCRFSGGGGKPFNSSRQPSRQMGPHLPGRNHLARVNRRISKRKKLFDRTTSHARKNNIPANIMAGNPNEWGHWTHSYIGASNRTMKTGTVLLWDRPASTPNEVKVWRHRNNPQLLLDLASSFQSKSSFSTSDQKMQHFSSLNDSNMCFFSRARVKIAAGNKGIAVRDCQATWRSRHWKLTIFASIVY